MIFSYFFKIENPNSLDTFQNIVIIVKEECLLSKNFKKTKTLSNTKIYVNKKSGIRFNESVITNNQFVFLISNSIRF